MLYEDDGVTRDYEKGRYAKTYMSTQHKDDVLTVKIAPAEGSYDGQLEKRSVVVELPGLSENARVKAPAKSKISVKDGVTYITMPEASISKERIVKITNPYILSR